MKYKALILDLDNTIYPVTSIGDKLFAPLFQLIQEHVQLNSEEFARLRADLMSKPFQTVAEHWNFSDELSKSGIAMLKEASYDQEMHPFSDYLYIRSFPITKFLVTKGFRKLQSSKVRQLNIADDFLEVIIVDPEHSDIGKKEVFADILFRHHFSPTDILVIGDDPASEIQAAKDLEIPHALYDPQAQYSQNISTFHIRSYTEFAAILA